MAYVREAPLRGYKSFQNSIRMLGKRLVNLSRERLRGTVAPCSARKACSVIPCGGEGHTVFLLTRTAFPFLRSEWVARDWSGVGYVWKTGDFERKAACGRWWVEVESFPEAEE